MADHGMSFLSQAPTLVQALILAPTLVLVLRKSAPLSVLTLGVELATESGVAQYTLLKTTSTQSCSNRLWHHRSPILNGSVTQMSMAVQNSRLMLRKWAAMSAEAVESEQLGGALGTALATEQAPQKLG